MKRSAPAVLLGLALGVLGPGCNCDPGGGGDAGPPDAGPADAGRPDGGADAGPGDAGMGDAGPGDAGAADGGQDVSCLDAGVVTSQETVTTTSLRLQGATAGTQAGHFVVTADGGATLEGPVPTSGGAYDVTLPLFCGTQAVELSWPGPVCTSRVQVAVDRQQCTATDLQVTLSWDDQGLDFELHLVRQGGRINDDATDCTWTSCITSAPDWGVVGEPADDPHKDVDNTGYYGPENIFLNRPEALSYTVLVEHWGSGLATASGQVTILLSDGTSRVLPITHLAAHWVDTVAVIDWPSRTITPVGTFTDCTASWSEGCTLPLPPAP